MLGSGKKNTKIYKAEHIPSGKYYALKEVEAKTLEKLNEYKVSNNNNFVHLNYNRKKQFNYSKFKITQTCSNSTATTSMRPCITHSESQWSASIWTLRVTSSTSSERESSKTYFGVKIN